MYVTGQYFYTWAQKAWILLSKINRKEQKIPKTIMNFQRAPENTRIYQKIQDLTKKKKNI